MTYLIYNLLRMKFNNIKINNLITQAKKLFRTENLRYTKQREELLKELYMINEHFDVELIYSRLKDRGINISMASIYRTIPLLKKWGIIREVTQVDNRILYEYSFQKEHHGHLVCVNCGKIIEFYNEKIEKFQNNICENYNFKPVTHKLIIKGLCKECLEEMNENSIKQVE